MAATFPCSPSQVLNSCTELQPEHTTLQHFNISQRPAEVEELLIQASVHKQRVYRIFISHTLSIRDITSTENKTQSQNLYVCMCSWGPTFPLKCQECDHFHHVGIFGWSPQGNWVLYFKKRGKITWLQYLATVKLRKTKISQNDYVWGHVLIYRDQYFPLCHLTVPHEKLIKKEKSQNSC